MPDLPHMLHNNTVLNHLYRDVPVTTYVTGVFLTLLTPLLLPFFYLLGYYTERLGVISVGNQSVSLSSNIYSRVITSVKTAVFLFTVYSIFALPPSLITTWIVTNTALQWGILPPNIFVIFLVGVVLFFSSIITLFIPIILCRIARTGTFSSAFDYKKYYGVFTHDEFLTVFKPSLIAMAVVLLGHITIFFISPLVFFFITPITTFTSSLILTHLYAVAFGELTGTLVSVTDELTEQELNAINTTVQENSE
jgi:hypothetical protein